MALKVGICIPSGGMVHTEFAVALAMLVATAGVPMVIVNVESSLPQVNRDNAVRQALDANCSHILFLDSDMTFPPDALGRLIEHGKDIVGCLYSRRVAPYGVLGNLVENAIGESPDPLRPAIELGLGCTLIDARVFARLKAPYFRCVAIESVEHPPAELAGMDLTDYEAPTTMGEDYYFCKSARRAGFEVWADADLSMDLAHIGMIAHRLAKKG